MNNYCDDCLHKEVCADKGINESLTYCKDKLVDKWIPVERELPDKYGIYLVTLNNHDTDFCEFYPNDRTFGMNGNVCYEVTAWCELPQPYKGESEDKCKNCKYYRNPDYTRCHECEAEREDKE